VIGTWQHFHGERYVLHAWVVMPTHVHVLIQLTGTAPLATIIQSWKSFSSRRLPVDWQRDYWDRCIRSPEHYAATVAYIHDNPVRAGLCPTPQAWPWSSAGGASSSSPS